jgi:hypothetical protein
MHWALSILEVLPDVFAHLHQYSSTKTLAKVTRTCKSFHEPAMDFLWADMPVNEDLAITPLLGCVTRLHPIIYDSGKVSMGYLRR